MLFSIFLNHDFPSVPTQLSVFCRAADVDTRCLGLSGTQINALQGVPCRWVAVSVFHTADAECVADVDDKGLPRRTVTDSSLVKPTLTAMLILCW